jgi:hypothetical protein
MTMSVDARCRSGQPFGGRHPWGCDEPQAEGSRFCAFHRDQLHSAYEARPAKPGARSIAGARAPVETRADAKEAAVRAIVDHVAAHPGVPRRELVAATGTTFHRLRQALADGLIYSRHNAKGGGYFINTDNEENG